MVAQANVRNPIIGSGGGVQEAQQEMLVLFESAVIEEDISKSISRYQLAIQNTKVKLNFAITPGTWLLPSEMLINMERIDGYNNKLQKATYNMKFGSNNFVNTPLPPTPKTVSSHHSKPPLEVNSKTKSPSHSESIVASSVRANEHETNLTSITIAVVGVGWYLFR